MSLARSSKSSRAIPSQQKELESRIIRWLSEKERKGMLVGGIQIKAQALKFANEMQIEDLGLKFSDGWMRHFKSLHGLHYEKAHGEAKSQEWLANRYATHF